MLSINSENLTIVTFATFGKSRNHRDYTIAVARLRQSCASAGLDILVSSFANGVAEVNFLLQGRQYSMRKGAGYWSWKPNVIREASKYAKTRYLMYLDSDLILKRVPDFSNIENFNEFGVAVLQTSDKLVDWTSKRCLKYFHIQDCQKYRILFAGAVLVDLQNDNSSTFLDIWEKHLSNYELLLDPFWSLRLNHRHDQSILSCLVASSQIRVALLPQGFFQTNSFNQVNETEAWLIHGETNLKIASRIRSFLPSLKSKIFHKYQLGTFLFLILLSSGKEKLRGFVK